MRHLIQSILMIVFITCFIWIKSIFGFENTIILILSSIITKDIISDAELSKNNNNKK